MINPLKPDNRLAYAPNLLTPTVEYDQEAVLFLLLTFKRKPDPIHGVPFQARHTESVRTIPLVYTVYSDISSAVGCETKNA